MTDAVDARVMDLADCQVKIPRTTYTYAAVSHTHLDVYKRQIYN